MQSRGKGENINLIFSSMKLRRFSRKRCFVCRQESHRPHMRSAFVMNELGYAKTAAGRMPRRHLHAWSLFMPPNEVFRRPRRAGFYRNFKRQKVAGRAKNLLRFRLEKWRKRNLGVGNRNWARRLHSMSGYEIRRWEELEKRRTFLTVLLTVKACAWFDILYCTFHTVARSHG